MGEETTQTAKSASSANNGRNTRMSEFIVRDTDSGNEKTFSSRSDAEDAKSDLESLGATVEITQADAQAEVVDHRNQNPRRTPNP